MFSKCALRALLLGLALLFPPISAMTYAQGRQAAFQSVNFPKRYIRHRQSLGYVDEINGALAKKDATFIIVPGLAGRCSSFESTNYPGHFLRHQNFRIKLAKRTDEQLFKDDATFCIRTGMANSSASSFESVNAPNHFIRHRNFELWLDRRDPSPLFRKDATFHILPGVSVIIDDGAKLNPAPISAGR